MPIVTDAHHQNAISSAKRLPKYSIKELKERDLVWVKEGKEYWPARVAPRRAALPSEEITHLRVEMISKGDHGVTVAIERCFPFLTAFERCMHKNPKPDLEDAVNAAKLEAHEADLALDPVPTDVELDPPFDAHDEEEVRQELLMSQGKRCPPVSGDILDYAAKLASYGGRGDPTIISLNIGGQRISSEGFKV
jgi:hypothetical protein